MVSAPPPVQALRAVPHHAVPPSLIQGTSTPWAQTRSVVQASNLSYCTQLKSLTLGDGTVLTFTTDDIPDPPAASSEFLDIVKLNAQWDNTSPDWQGTAFLCIKDRPIAVKYWPTVYCHTKDPQKCKQWQGTKNNWCKWKDVIERYRQGTPEQFWEKFSQNGKRMSFTAINRHLQEARVKLGASFDSVCSYRKGGEVHVLRRPLAIVKRLELLGAEHADVPVE
ncbi:hypothetical protein V8E55_005680 [Tylopilus felleus]